MPLLPVTAFGWVRRAELDGPGYVVWERPDGMTWAAPPNTLPHMDRETGQLCLYEPGSTP